MWDWLVQASSGALGSGARIDPSQSFFVGDAAGRAGEHSDTDKRFAAAAGGGLRFHNEKEFFEELHQQQDYPQANTTM